ncbi:MAG: PilZ domain-containing protein [Lachnospiraceae bacterium]|nr:PilZ domain-containing protein [Lachnospiraceae bacterium]
MENTITTEKRKFKRLPVTLTLEISSLFKQDHEKIEGIEAPIHVTDISKGGIGFISTSDFPLDYYFNACIQLGDEDAKLFTVIKLIRKEYLDDGSILYGCELVGVAPVLSFIFEDYEKKLREEGLLE